MTLLLLAGVFVVVAAGFALLEHRLQRMQQPALRSDVGRDALHVLLSNSLPAALVRALGYALLAVIASQHTFELMYHRSLVLQLVVILLITDLGFYLVHRAMHRVPVLWRLHRMHHSPVEMDWLSGYRKHALETVVHGGVVFLPVALLGFSPTAYLVFGGIGIFFAGFTHLNIRPELRWLEPFVVTPRYHAWHHALDAGEQAQNLAGKLTVFDWVFGSRRADSGDAWPEALGLKRATPTVWWPSKSRTTSHKAGKAL